MDASDAERGRKKLYGLAQAEILETVFEEWGNLYEFSGRNPDEAHKNMMHTNNHIMACMLYNRLQGRLQDRMQEILRNNKHLRKQIFGME